MATNESRQVLVTGATGRLGTEVCRTLVEAGHTVRATDRNFRPDFPAPLELGDLLDEHFVYRVLDGCDSVVHLGNHPNAYTGPSRQRLLADNVAMNANVFCAAVDLEVQCIVFASSVQAMLRKAGAGATPPFTVPYFPLDGAADTDPGDNAYALSKEFAERMLRLDCELHPDLSATALRFPMLPPPWWTKRLSDPHGVARESLNWGECLTHLLLDDAAALIVRVVERRLSGYHQYFPAHSMEVRNQDLPDLIAQMYPNVPLRRPASELSSLVDLTELERDLGWRPRHRIQVTVRD